MISDQFVLTGSHPTPLRYGLQRASVTVRRSNTRMRTLGQRIRELRELRGISRKDCADRAGLAYSTLADLENGASDSTRKLHKLAEVLTTTTRWLEKEQGPRDAGIGTDPQTGKPIASGRDLAELRIALSMTIQALTASRPDAGESLAAALAGLPGEMPERPYIRDLLGTIRGELEKQALGQLPNQPAPKSGAPKRQ